MEIKHKMPIRNVKAKKLESLYNTWQIKLRLIKDETNFYLLTHVSYLQNFQLQSYKLVISTNSDSSDSVKSKLF